LELKCGILIKYGFVFLNRTFNKHKFQIVIAAGFKLLNNLFLQMKFQTFYFASILI